MHRPPTSTLFPYTTLFRSIPGIERRVRRQADVHSSSSAPPVVALRLATPPSPPVPRRWAPAPPGARTTLDRKSTRLNSSHVEISYAVFCLKKKKHNTYY